MRACEWMATAAAVALALGGCSHPKRPGVYVGSSSSYITNLPSSAVIVSVNGEKLRRRDFDARQSFYNKFLRLRNNAALQGDNARAAVGTRNREQRVVPEFIRDALLEQEASRLGISAPSTYLADDAGKLARMLHRPGKTLDEIAGEMGKPEGAVFLKQVQADCRDRYLKEIVGSNKLVVADADVDAYSNRVETFNQWAKTTNAVLRQTATALAGSLRQKGDFAAAAVQFGQVEPGEGKFWETVAIDGIENADLRKWVKSAAAGDISDPIEMEDGLAIVKVLNKTKDNGDSHIPQMADLARITFHIADPQLMPERREIRQFLRAEAMQRVHNELIDRLWAQAVIEYPNGTNLFPAATEEMKRPVFFPEERKKQ